MRNMVIENNMYLFNDVASNANNFPVPNTKRGLHWWIDKAYDSGVDSTVNLLAHLESIGVSWASDMACDIIDAME